MVFLGIDVETGRHIAVRHKYTGEILAEVPEASPEDVAQAVHAAAQAAERVLPPLRRYQILSEAARRVAEAAEELALLICREVGKPYKDARVEVDRAVQTLTLSAEEAKRLGGEVLPIEAAPGGEGRLAFTMRVPVGVVAAITPFNFPLNLVAHKVGPALAAGNAVVLKPATVTPLSALRLRDILVASGLPEAYLQVVIGPGSTVGEALLSDPRIAFYTFTGSAAIGRRIKERTGLRRVALELGNNSPNIVLADADLDQAAEVLARRAHSQAGQSCISVQRIYVEQGVYEAFLDRLLTATDRLVVGDPESPETDVGPMISEEEARRAESWIREAVDGGAHVLRGGDRTGPLLEPTVLVGVKPDMKVVCQEVFAPVVSVIPVADLDEAIAQANDTAYGLQAGIFTQSLSRAMEAVRRLRFGGVIVNDSSSFRADLMPYGGIKESGMGREGPRYAVEEMTELRTVVIRP